MGYIVLIILGYLGYKWYSNNKNRSNYHGFDKDVRITHNYMDDNYMDIQQGVKVEDSKFIDTDKSPFLIANSLLTSAELNFYKVLREAVSENQIICPKVRMQDVLWTKTYRVKDKQTFINKVNRKHFDFVICDKDTLKPLMAIELDDKSHEEEDRKERDEFVDALFIKSLGFRVIHIPVRYSYDIIKLQDKIYGMNSKWKEHIIQVKEADNKEQIEK